MYWGAVGPTQKNATREPAYRTKRMSLRRQNTTQTSQNPVTEPLQNRVPSTNDPRTRPTTLDNQSSFRDVPPRRVAGW